MTQMFPNDLYSFDIQIEIWHEWQIKYMGANHGVDYIRSHLFFPQECHHLNEVRQFSTALGYFMSIYVYTTWEVELR